MDGDIITEEMSTNLALQRDFAEIRSLVVGYLICNFCDTPILSSGVAALTNQTKHQCANCDSDHFSEIPCVSNPIIKTFNKY